MEPREGLATKKDLEGVERTLSEKIDRVEKTLDEKIDRVEKTLDKKIDRVEKTLSGKIEENRRKISRVALQVIKNSEAINKMVTRDEFNEFRMEVLSGQDKMMTILTRIDQERAFTNEWVRRIEAQGEQNKRDIERIKVG